MVLNRKGLRFKMEMLQGCSSMTSRDHTEAIVLHGLDLFEMRGLQVRRVDRRGEVRNRGGQRLKGEQHVFRLVPPIRTGQGLKNLETGAHLVDDPLGMGAEGKMGIERHAKDLGVFDERDQGTFILDLRVVMVLVRIRSKKGHA